MFQNASIGNVTINIYEGSDAVLVIAFVYLPYIKLLSEVYDKAINT